VPANISGIPGSSGCIEPAKPASNNTSAKIISKAVIIKFLYQTRQANSRMPIK